eukprot:scaffold4195_cov250-Pinguiococcus_pyrenoidosus.AAC.1
MVIRRASESLEKNFCRDFRLLKCFGSFEDLVKNVEVSSSAKVSSWGAEWVMQLRGRQKQQLRARQKQHPVEDFYLKETALHWRVRSGAR